MKNCPLRHRHHHHWTEVRSSCLRLTVNHPELTVSHRFFAASLHWSRRPRCGSACCLWPCRGTAHQDELARGRGRYTCLPLYQ